MTQQQVARTVGVHRVTVSRWGKAQDFQALVERCRERMATESASTEQQLRTEVHLAGLRAMKAILDDPNATRGDVLKATRIAAQLIGRRASPGRHATEPATGTRMTALVPTAEIEEYRRAHPDHHIAEITPEIEAEVARRLREIAQRDMALLEQGAGIS